MRACSLKLNLMTHTFWIFNIGLINNKNSRYSQGVNFTHIVKVDGLWVLKHFIRTILPGKRSGIYTSFILNWRDGALIRVCLYVLINLNSYLLRKHYANDFIFWLIRPRKKTENNFYYRALLVFVGFFYIFLRISCNGGSRRLLFLW